ncbi:T9SS type A sorting domain-containing protein [Bacteroidales bacterium OttesenSCG-928-A17]|nr:T9SS type A sorting domain-containing protein [Bacteroidales bacterium OttesenSCG-928-A17]
MKGIADDEIVRIITVSGVLVSEIRVENKNPIDISHLPQGIYLIKAGDVVKKLIKQ